ncbi:MAG TPA: sugar O-acetyltransferase, partial [Flavisolibacter sp.]|nr:sugar O-acetyltransferase [Flavisolibacter sp.]
PELADERRQAKEILCDFNHSRPGEMEKRGSLLKKLLSKTQNNLYIEPPFQCDYGYNIEIGNNFYANHNLIILDCAKVTIGNFVFLGPNVGIYTAGHPLHAHPRNQEFEFALPIRIGDNVWIGGNVAINPGITIGNNTVIGSGSVVTKDIPSNVLAFGNPCKVVREITDKDRDY